MEEQFDTQALMTRAQLVAREIRKSDAFPALIGGIAGGIAGALMAVIIAGRIAAPREPIAPREKASPKFDWSVRELMQLATVVAPLLKQIQAWSKEQRGR
ncbi:MAG: hypothetical protein L0Y55_19260 [Anaerolineales bacterium]|nr:hypothetical protein [Anaerolineales bacterium]